MSKSTNFNPAELAKFSALAERWWNPESEFRPLHEINPLRLAWICSLKSIENQRVLDVGCGGGILTEAMARKNAIATGIDLADKPLKVAALHAQNAGVDVTYEAISAEDLALRLPANFDLITCMEMLEHVPNPEPVIAACAAMVKPDGWVFFSTINRNPLSWLVAIFGAEYLLRMLPKGTHNHKAFIKPAELIAWAEKYGLVLQDKRGLSYNPFSKQFSLNRFLGVGYLLAMKKTR
jgi:2-polyprenyl-6-hydroxyphenyl methylase / 3-demethylubiquinone-9 3-methyltransferase